MNAIRLESKNPSAAHKVVLSNRGWLLKSLNLADSETFTFLLQ